MAIINSLLGWYFKRRLQSFNYAIQNSDSIQKDLIINLLKEARDTDFGRQFDFKSITTYEQFAKEIPIHSYEDLAPKIEQMLQGSQNILWPSEITWFAKSSGTTDSKSKFIPVSFEILENCHFQGGRDALTLFMNQHPESKIFDGKGLLIGGSNSVNPLNENSFYGDLSAVMMKHLPIWASLLKTPTESVALLGDWEKKLDMMVKETVNENVTSISGVPTWTLVLFERMLETTGKANMLEVWPNLELYIHGGVNFAPYREQFKKFLPSDKVTYLETYNASEGFFGVQTDPNSRLLTLLPHYSVFYEFIPMSEFGGPNQKVLPLWQVEPGVNYAVVITTQSGLWRYIIGDTIQFETIKPYRFHITGRTKLFINAFGEELMIDNADTAIEYACSQTNALLRDYSAAPVYLTDPDNAGHQWLVEFESEPDSLEEFRKLLDSKLKELNSDYEAKRHKDIALKMPLVQSIPKGTFEKWLKSKGKLGGQNKIPRLSNNRIIMDEILALLNQQSI